MIYLVNNSANTFYVTAMETYTGTTFPQTWTVNFTSDSNNYNKDVRCTLVNRAATGTTLIRYSEFSATSGQCTFDYNGYYTYRVYHPTTGQLLETGRAKIISNPTTNKTTTTQYYLTGTTQKVIYKK